MLSLELATPISHLFLNEDTGQRISQASDCLECRDRTIDINIPNQRLFHSDVQPIHEFSSSIISYIEKIAAKKPDLDLVSFHIASNCDHPTIENGMFVSGGRTFSRSEMVDNAKQNFRLIRQIFGPKVKIAVENNNYYRTSAYDVVTDPDFISEITRECDVHLLFDIAHARVSAHNFGVSYAEYKNALPLHRAIQLHLCSFDIDPSGRAVDAHKLPSAEDIYEAFSVAGKTPVKYLTVEFYKDENLLVECLNALKGGYATA